MTLHVGRFLGEGVLWTEVCFPTVIALGCAGLGQPSPLSGLDFPVWTTYGGHGPPWGEYECDRPDPQ